jgi:hypothetical protein
MSDQPPPPPPPPPESGAAAAALAASLLPGTPVCLAHVSNATLRDARGVVARAAPGAAPLTPGHVHVLLLSPPHALAAYPVGVSVAAHKLAVEGTPDPGLLPAAKPAAEEPRRANFPTAPSAAPRELTPSEQAEAAACEAAPSAAWFPEDEAHLAALMCTAGLMSAGSGVANMTTAECLAVLERGRVSGSALGAAVLLQTLTAAARILLHRLRHDAPDDATAAACLKCLAAMLPSEHALRDSKLRLTLLEATSVLLRGGGSRAVCAVEAGLLPALASCAAGPDVSAATASCICLLCTDIMTAPSPAGQQPYWALSRALEAGILESLVPLLGQRASSREVPESESVLMVLLAMLSRGGAAARRRAAAAGLLAMLRRVLARVPPDSTTLQSVASVMCELSEHGTQPAFLRELDESDLRRLLTAVTAAQSVDMAEAPLRAVTAACNIVSLRPVAASLGAFEAAVAVMRRLPADARAQAAGLSLIANVASGYVPNKRRAGAVGAMAAAFDVCTRHAADATVMTSAVLCIENLTANCYQNASAADAAAVALLLGVLRQHASSEHISAHAMFAISNICTAGGEEEAPTNSAAEERKRAAFVTGGGFTLVVAALARFPRDPLLQEAGAAVLFRFCSNMGAPLRTACLDAGTVPTVLRGMAAFAGDPSPDASSAVDAGCRFLTRIFAVSECTGAVFVSHIERACAAGAARTCVALLRRFQAAGDELRVAHAADALTSLARPATLQALMDAGALAAAAASLRAMPTDHFAFAGLCNVITMVLSERRDAQTEVSASGAIEALVAGVACRTGAPGPVKHAGWTAIMVASAMHKDAAAKARAVCAGVMEALDADTKCAAPCVTAFGSADQRRQFVALMAAAAAEHDTHATGSHAGCTRCEGLRAAGRMCGARGCGARARRADDAAAAAKTRKLAVCSGCNQRAYCCTVRTRNEHACMPCMRCCIKHTADDAPCAPCRVLAGAPARGLEPTQGCVQGEGKGAAHRGHMIAACAWRPRPCRLLCCRHLAAWTASRHTSVGLAYKRVLRRCFIRRVRARNAITDSECLRLRARGQPLLAPALVRVEGVLCRLRRPAVRAQQRLGEDVVAVRLIPGRRVGACALAARRRRNHRCSALGGTLGGTLGLALGLALGVAGRL